MLLRESLAPILPPRGIKIEGVLANGLRTLDGKELDEFLTSSTPCKDSVQVLLIDGPAGIGKTKLIEMIALARADNYTSHRRSLVLHVQSRGRVLSYLQESRMEPSQRDDCTTARSRHAALGRSRDLHRPQAAQDGANQAER